jgi:hypothetical protein
MFTSIRKYKATRGSAEDLARRVQRVSNQTANLQTNELSAKERLNGWPGALRDCCEKDRRRGGEGLASVLRADLAVRLALFRCFLSCPNREFRSVRRG